MEFWNVERFNLARKVEAAALVIAISEFTRAQLMGFVDSRHWSKIDVVHCGVDLDRYPPRAQRRDGEGAGPGDEVEILCVGRLSPEKGQSLLLRAVAEVRRTGRAARLVLVGDGPLREQLERERDELGLGDDVTFAGAVDQDAMPAFYQRADIFCQPSFMEGIPVVLMEAMASGLPVVSSGVAGIPELVEHERSGLLIPPGRESTLARALARLVDSRELREQMGRRGRTIVEQSYDGARCAASVGVLFDDLAAEERTRSDDVPFGR